MKKQTEKKSRTRKKSAKHTKLVTTAVPEAATALGDPSEADAEEFAEAFARVEAEIEAVAETDLIRVTVDVPTAVMKIVGALPAILGFASQMSELAGFDQRCLAQLRNYTFALAHTHAKYKAAAEPRTALGALIDELMALREQWTADATVLVRRGLLDAENVARLRTGLGHKNVAFDVQGFVELFREHWSTLEGRSFVQQSDLERASKLVSRVVKLLAQRDQGETQQGDAILLRLKAFTLCINAYDEVQRALNYLRWHHGDLETIAPSVWAGRTKRRVSNAEDAASPTETAPSPALPVITPNGAAATAALASGANA